MATSDFLFQSSAPASFTNTIETRSDMPDWYQAARRQLITRASQIVNEPYQQYTGQRIAGLNQDQQNAYQQTRNTVAQGNQYGQQAANMIQAGGSGFNQNQFNQYLNPYTGQMMDELTRQATKNLNENLLPQVNDTFTGAGMFGSSRFGDFTQRAINDTQQTLLGQQANLLGSSYNNAMTAYGQGQDRQIAGGQQLGALGQTLFNQGITGASALEAIGNTQQNLDQRSLDLAYQDFVDQRDAPLKNLETMSGVINAYTPQPNQVASQNTPITQVQYQPSPLSQILGSFAK